MFVAALWAAPAMIALPGAAAAQGCSWDELPGREVDFPATGLALGASARLRFPLASSQSLLIGVGVRASFLPTVELSGLAEDTPRVLVTLPITVGYRFSL